MERGEEEEEEGRLHSAPRSHAQIIGNAAKNKRWRKENISRLRSGSSQLCLSPTLLPFPLECSDTAAGKSRRSSTDGMMKLLPGRKSLKDSARSVCQSRSAAAASMSEAEAAGWGEMMHF